VTRPAEKLPQWRERSGSLKFAWTRLVASGASLEQLCNGEFLAREIERLEAVPAHRIDAVIPEIQAAALGEIQSQLPASVRSLLPKAMRAAAVEDDDDEKQEESAPPPPRRSRPVSHQETVAAIAALQTRIDARLGPDTARGPQLTPEQRAWLDRAKGSCL
jgi:hypothetical protein